MKIIYATYYDHIDRAGYMPELVVENWLNCDERVVCSAPGQVDRLSSRGLDATIVDIGIGISKPSDIPRAQNAAIDQCFRMGADWVIYIHGDHYLSAGGDIFLREACQVASGNPVQYTIPVYGVKLYCAHFVHAFTITISHKTARIIYDEQGDGVRCNIWNPCVEPSAHVAYDIGYIGMPQYKAKMENHGIIWNDSTHKDLWLKMYERNMALAVQFAYKEIRWSMSGKLEPIDLEHYGMLLNRMDLMADYNYCMGILHG